MKKEYILRYKDSDGHPVDFYFNSEGDICYEEALPDHTSHKFSKYPILTLDTKPSYREEGYSVDIFIGKKIPKKRLNELLEIRAFVGLIETGILFYEERLELSFSINSKKGSDNFSLFKSMKTTWESIKKNNIEDNFLLSKASKSLARFNNFQVLLSTEKPMNEDILKFGRIAVQAEFGENNG